MNPNDATIYEVARRAGVSISTVSLAINHPERVKAATRDRVLAAVDETGFMPKERAIARARAGVGRIALVAPFTSYPSFSRRMTGALAAIDGDGTQLLVYDHEDIATSASPLLASMPVRGHVDGLVIMSVPLDERIVARLAGRLPTVLVGVKDPRLPSVWADDFAGGQLVGARFRGWGHQRVAFVRETEVSFLEDSPTQLRVNGLRSVVGAENVREVTVSRTGSAGAEAVAALFDADESWNPTAIFANRDLVALGIVSALRASGRRVPEDVSVVGYDDDVLAAAVGLSTVENPLEESGRQAIRIIRQLLAGQAEVPMVHELPLMFRDRRTAGPIASATP